jgi:hypothetical protein
VSTRLQAVIQGAAVLCYFNYLQMAFALHWYELGRLKESDDNRRASAVDGVLSHVAQTHCLGD